MKLLTKLFLITDSKGNEINVEKKNIILALNGERTTALKDIFSGLEFDDGEIYGNSLLSYYHVNEDGSLEVEGSKIQLLDADTDELILVKKIKHPGVHDNSIISFEDIQKFSDYFKIAKPEEVFSSLTAEEKQIFVSGREEADKAKEEAASTSKATQEETERQEAATKAQEKKELRDKEEAELKASIDPQFVLDKNGYESIRSYYAGLEGFKHYVKGPYELFYGDDPSQAIGVIIKRGDAWHQEIKEEDAEIMERNDKEVIIEFPDKAVRTRLTLNREAQEIEISEAKATE